MTTSSKQVILVTGGDGQLGRCLQEIAPKSKHRFIFTDLEQMDITSEESVRALFERERPDWVVNCAAYTAVDRAESEPELAEKINATAVSILAKESQRIDASLLHISTDYVFAGENPTPLTEEEPTAPRSVYGTTKLQGEHFAAQNPKHVILRTSWLYSAYGNNFVKTMRRLGAERSEISVVADQWGNPTSAHDLAQAILKVISKPTYGTYHFSNEGVASWALFVEQVMVLSGLECEVLPIPTTEYPTPAKRPAYSLMSKQKFTQTFKMKIPEWEASLEEVIEKLDQVK